VRFLRELSDIAAIDEAVNREECFRLVLSAVDPLANGDELEAGKVQLAIDREDALRTPGEPRRVVDEDYIKRLCGRERRAKQLLKRRAIHPYAA
jgi:hypothetical protein